MIRSIDDVLDRFKYIPQLQNKIVYDHFSTAQTLPFAAYTYTSYTDGADDFKGIQWINFNLELYTEIRDFELENTILTVFDDVEIQSDSTYLDSERMYITSFAFVFPHKIY